jgi:hypothetical protein
MESLPTKTLGVHPLEMTVLDLFDREHVSGATISIIYDAYSSAWQIPLYLLRHALDEGYYGVVSNYSVPVRMLLRKMEIVGLNAVDALEQAKLAIIDLFGTRYMTREDLPWVFYLDKVEPETLNPKIEMIYRGQLKNFMSKRKVIRLIYTLDGASLMLGENSTLKLLNQSLASKIEYIPDSTLILALNHDVVSKKFVAWVAGISDYVILARSRLEDEGLKENLYLISAPHEEFEPTAYSFKVTKEKGSERLKVKKISP